ncbi:MAG: hypothetical protein LBH00_07705 [Planctomycetaceae bacterium]|jgi:hypothetical protein|nr:hypothetical protein [Planctomycetaceae bacterium]
MSETNRSALSYQAAYQLANVTKTTAQFGSLTPRWLPRFLDWKSLETGIYRLNKVKEEGFAGSTVTDPLCCMDGCCRNIDDNSFVQDGYIGYEEFPREYRLNALSTIINIDTRVADLYSSPYGQTEEQIRLAVESLKERQEMQLVNSSDYGLLHQIAEPQRIKPIAGTPTPDDFDELISKVWKEPSFFLAHPRAIAAFGRECTRRGVPPATVSFYGTNFLTWRGIPIVPSDKLLIDDGKTPKGKGGKTNILLIRTGENKRGVLGLHQADLPGGTSRGLAVRFMGVNQRGFASYLLSVYCSLAVLADDAAALLENVDVGNYYKYDK